MPFTGIHLTCVLARLLIWPSNICKVRCNLCIQCTSASNQMKMSYAYCSVLPGHLNVVGRSCLLHSLGRIMCGCFRSSCELGSTAVPAFGGRTLTSGQKQGMHSKRYNLGSLCRPVFPKARPVGHVLGDHVAQGLSFCDAVLETKDLRSITGKQEFSTITKTAVGLRPHTSCSTLYAHGHRPKHLRMQHMYTYMQTLLLLGAVYTY